MTVDDKITFAKYFLDKIKNAQTREDFLPNLTAFLSEACSIPDYLLEDANVKFGLGIRLAKNLRDKFAQTAENQKNVKALEFIVTYKIEVTKLREHPIGKLLIGKRNIKVHRTEEGIQANFVRGLVETVHIHDSVSVVVMDKDGKLKNKSNSRDANESLETKREPITKEKEPSIKSTDSVKWQFEDYKTADAIDVCQQFFDLMKSFVESLKTKLP